MNCISIYREPVVKHYSYSPRYELTVFIVLDYRLSNGTQINFTSSSIAGCRRKWDFRRSYFCGYVTFISGTRR